MRTLLTWSDRGTKRRAAHRSRPRPGDHGPIMRFVRAPERAGQYNHAIILTSIEGRRLTAELVDELRSEISSVEVRAIKLDDPSNYEHVFSITKNTIADLGPGEVDVVLSAGTPQMQTVWVVLVKAGFLDARLFQVIPPAFVPRPHPFASREVKFDFDGFPEIMALRDEVQRLRSATRDDNLIGRSEPMTELRQRIQRVAPSTIPLLIIGETGVGKELVAQAIHAHSPRAKGPFVAENCGALSDSVLESELFGHEKGAFTGALGQRKGLFERADGGTLFLDEVGELTPRVQATLLRVLQEGRFRRVGGEHEVSVDVRVVGATHRDLRAMIGAGEFREDLYYRLAGARLVVPPLRDRIEDLPLLIAAFEEPNAPRLSGDALRELRRFSWPGNVRQLRAEVRRWAVFCDDVVRQNDLSDEILGLERVPSAVAGTGRTQARPTTQTRTLIEAVQQTEESLIRLTLTNTSANLAQTARALGVDRNTLKRKIRLYTLSELVDALRQKS